MVHLEKNRLVLLLIVQMYNIKYYNNNNVNGLLCALCCHDVLLFVHEMGGTVARAVTLAWPRSEAVRVRFRLLPLRAWMIISSLQPWCLGTSW
jgi:hypothetical protein